MFIGVEDGEGVIAEGEDGGGGGWMGKVFAEDDAAVAQMESVKKAKSEVPDRVSR